MSDAHIEAIMPIIGRELVRLELVNCAAWDNDGLDPILLSDNGVTSIAQYCNQLWLIALVDAQEKESGVVLFLRLLGCVPHHEGPQLTIRGVKHAIEKGVDEIEWSGPLHRDDLIEYFGLGVRLHQSDHRGYIDGTTECIWAWVK